MDNFNKLKGLDLFSGYGGITLGLEDWVRPVAYCEIEPYAQGILLSRMEDGSLPLAPIWNDVSTLRGYNLPEIDIIYGGFPCQDISVAGNGKGLAGERSGLFYELCRLVEEIHPKFIFLENVPAIRTRGLLEVIREFTDLGYDCRWTRVSAREVEAPHRRERWFLLAHSNLNRCSEQTEATSKTTSRRRSETTTTECDRWPIEPNVGRVDDGTPFRMDRIKLLGNGVVPKQVKEAFIKLSGVK